MGVFRAQTAQADGADFVLNVDPVAVPANRASYQDFLPDRIRAQYGPTTSPFAEDLYFGKISWDILHPAYQGQGLGSALTLYRIEKLRAMEEIQIISVLTSQHVYRFYEKLGFVVKEIAADYWAPGFDLYRMEQEA